MTVKRSHVYISGRVQGVFFRGWVAERARALELGGWVRNLTDGRVEAVFEGETDKIDRMVALCHEGPAHARVDTVSNDDSHAADGLAGFEVRGTA